MPVSNLACEANINSLKQVMAGDKASWLALFADDAVIHDPVGPSPHDPEGKGFKGPERISEFWDTMIATGDLIIVPHRRIAVGEHIACVNMTATNRVAGLKTSIEMVAVYEVHPDGKVKSLNVYWDVEALDAQIQAQTA